MRINWLAQVYNTIISMFLLAKWIKSVYPDQLASQKPADLDLQFSKTRYIFCFDCLHPSQQFFSHVRTGLPGLNQY